MRPLFLPHSGPEWGSAITTVRQRTPRSLAEAFPHDHADAIERPAHRAAEALAGWLLGVAVGLGLAAALVSWWSS